MAEIGINLRADPAQFEAGVKVAQKAMDEWQRASEDSAADVGDKLEQVLRAMVKLGTQTGKTKDEMVSDLRKFGLSAEQAEDAVEAVWEEMGQGQRAARGVEKAADALEEVEAGADKAADATSKVGDASKQTGSDVSDLGNIARDVLEGDFGSAAEGAISALGALGVFAGAGGALAATVAYGAGSIIGDWITQWTSGAEATKKLVADMYSEMIESGRVALSDQFVTNKIAEIYDPEKPEEFNRAVQISNQLGIERSDIIRAMAGDEDANRQVIEQSRDKLAALNEQQEAYIAANGRESAALGDKIGEVERGIRAYDLYAGAQDTAAGRAREAIDAINATAGAAGAASGKIDGVSLALNSMPPGKTVVVDADTSNFFANMEALRRQKWSISVGIDAVVNQRRGRQLVD
ncbi:hypothetical protein [Agromyces laixinhei]|uniref:hypothetical protein n=1 Tax=Agromyces laixinhei TaxID=2585717 RepID=UPI0012EE463B|nr:hypothetical protein [Agromyces laixinhei]